MRRLFVCLSLLLLAGCAGTPQTGGAPIQAPTATRGAVSPNPATAAPVAATTRPTVLVDVTSPPAPVTTTPAETRYSGIPQSKTTEGYQVLGRADAPGTIVFYSDFL